LGNAGNSYVGQFLTKNDGTEMKTYKDWETRVLTQSGQAILQWIPYSIFQNKSTNPNLDPISLFWGILLLILLFLGAYKAESWLLFIFVGCSIGVQLFYNETYAGMRYMVAVVPFLIFYFVYGLYALVSQGITLLNKNMKQNLIVELIIVLLVTVTLSSSYKDSFERLKKRSRFKTWNYLNTTQSFVEFIEMAEWVSEHIPQGKIIANRKPEVFYMYSNFYKTIGLPAMNTSPAEVLAFLDETKVNYILLDHWFTRAYSVVYPAIQQYPENFKLVYSVGGNTANVPPTTLFEYLPNSKIE
jgi:hypothetical protein